MKMRFEIKACLIQKILSMIIILCVFFSPEYKGELTRVYAAEVLPDSLLPEEEFNSGNKVTNCIPRINFYTYSDDASDYVNKIWDYRTSEDPVSGYEGYVSDFEAPSHSISGRSVIKWIKAAEHEKSSPDRSQWIYAVGYYALWPVTVNYHSATYVPEVETKNLEVTFSKKNSTNELELLGADTFSRTGFELVGWSKDEPNNQVDYEPGDTCAYGVDDSELNFYAVWRQLETIDVNVQYRPNGGNGSAVNKTVTASVSQDDVYSSSIILPKTSDFTREGYEFVGWTDGENDYAPGAKYVFDTDLTNLTFDALWERIPEITVTSQYKPNGGSGDTISVSETVRLSEDTGTGTIKLKEKVDFKRSGYNLSGWKDQQGKSYAFGAEYTVSESNKNPVFEAVWTEKKAGSVDIDVKKPVYVGVELKYDIDKNSDGDVTVEYKKRGADDEDYTKKVPTEPGKYTVRATLEETDDYTSAEDTKDFEIVFLTTPDAPYSYQEVKNNAGTVTDLKVIPAEGYSIGTSTTGSFDTSVLYSVAKSEGGIYLKSEKNKGITDKITLTDYSVKDTPKITVSEKTYYGTDLTVTATSLSPAEKKIEYKKAGAADSTYSATAPILPGDYVVRLSAPASGFYAAVNETKNFSIVYLEAPSSKAYLDGKKGNDGWFKSDVKIMAPEGYLISTTLGTGYTDSIKWNEKIDKLYYQRDDGAMTDGVDFDPTAKIDTQAPTVKFDSSLGINDPKGNVQVTLDNLTFTLEDDNLEKVTVNGKPYDISNGKCVITLDSGPDTESWTVVATDKAGNSYTFVIELSPQWMSDNVMPVGRTVTLKSNIAYSFASGSEWQVEADGVVDNTVYTGGSKFYVKKNMNCTFRQKSAN